MPRLPRNYIKTLYFHVMVQGINKSYIFEHEEEKKYYIKIIYEMKTDCDIDIIAYCIMDNHVHLLLKSEEINNLSNFMHKVNTKYALYYNRKYDRVGYVFRDRYKSEGIYSEIQLYNCIRYIYDNPVKAKICNKAENYKFSNYNTKYSKYLPKCNEYTFIDIDDNKNICKEVINEFLSDNKMSLQQLQKDNEKLRKLSIILKNNYKISLRKISENLCISREKIRNLYRS